MVQMTADRVVVEMIAKIDGYERNLNQARATSDRTFASIGKGAGAAETQSRVALSRAADNFDRFSNRTRASLGVVSAGLKGLFVGFAATLGVTGLLKVADAAKQLDAQLKLATATSGSFARAQEDVRRIAESTRSGLTETADLYSTFQRNARELGISQEQAARATETVTKAFQISGASAAEAAGGLRQFLQGIQSGTLRGEELNSVLENAPRLAKLLADSLGVTIGQLRAMGQEGELSASKLVAALTERRFTAGIDEEFKQLPVTFDQAMTQVANAAVITFGAFDRGGEFSTALANFITDGTGGFADLESSAENLGIEIRSVMAGLSDVFEPMLEGARSAFGTIGAEAQGLRGAIADILGSIDAVRNAVPRLANSIRDTARNSPTFGDRGLGLVGPNRALPSNLQSTFLQGANKSAVERQLKKIQSKALSDVLSEFGVGGKAGPAPRIAGGSSKKRTGRRGPSAEDIARREEQREQAFRNDLDRINEDLISARRALVNSAETLDQLDRDRVEQERSSYAEWIDSQVKLKKLRDDGANSEAAQLRLKNEQRAELERQLIDQRAAERKRREARAEEDRQQEVAQGFRDSDRELLESRLDLVRTAGERRDLERQLLDLQFDEERIQLEAIIARAEELAAIKDKTEAEQEAAKAAWAAAEVAQARLNTLPERQANAQQSQARDNASPLNAYFGDIQAQADDINTAFENIAAGGLATFTDALTDAIVNFRSLGDVGRAVLQAVTADLVRMAIQQAILATIGKTLGMGATSAASAQAATVAAAWAPAAAAASLATLGANAGPAAAALIGTNALSMALAQAGQGFRDGGRIYGPGGPTADRVPIMASSDEFMIRASSAKRIGYGALDHINRTGEIPGYAGGGRIRSISPMNVPATRSGGSFSGGADMSQLRSIVSEAINAFPSIKVVNRLDSGDVVSAGISDRVGEQALMNFVTRNSGRINAALNR